MNNTKKLLTTILCLAMILSCIGCSAAENPTDAIFVTIDGAALTFDANPYITNGRTMVPMRAIFEALGCSVTWNNDEKSVTAVSDSTTVKLTIGEATMYVNNIAVTLDQAAEITNDRTFVPVRAVSEALGCDVNWNNDARTVEISTVTNDNYVWRMTAMLQSEDYGSIGYKYMTMYGYDTQGSIASVSRKYESFSNENYTTFKQKDIDYYLQNGTSWNADITVNEQGLISELSVYNENKGSWNAEYYEYDAQDRITLASIETHDPNDAISEYGDIFTYEYRDDLNIIAEIRWSSMDPSVVISIYKIYYDGNGNPIKAVFSGSDTIFDAEYEEVTNGLYGTTAVSWANAIDSIIANSEESNALIYTFKYEKIYLQSDSKDAENSYSSSNTVSAYNRDKQIYTQYLLNGGYEELGVSKVRDGYKISTCMIDLNNDGTYELMLALEDEMLFFTYALLTIQDGTVTEMLNASGGAMSSYYNGLYIVYDNLEQRYAIALYEQVSSAMLCSYSYNIYYDIAAIKDGADITYAETKLSTIAYSSDIKSIKANTSLYHETDSWFTYYKLGDNYISKEDYENLESRFTTPTDEAYQLKETTLGAPIQ